MSKRNSVEIKVWMLRNEIKLVDICRALKFNSKTVWATINGDEHNKKVLTWLVDNGCPKKHLALPDSMREAA